MSKILKNTIITLLILTLGISTAFLAYLHFFAPAHGEPSGEWEAELAMTEQAAVMAYGWLQDIEAVSVPLEELETHMQGLSVRVELILEPAGHLQGAFRSNVLPESYDACNRAAYEAFAAVFRGIVAKRLYLAGYRGSTDREAVEALVTETFGMSTVDYLMSYGPALLPSLEELQALYGGAGTYKAEEGILVRQFDGGADEAREERYIRGDTDLILYGEADSGDAGFLGKPYPLAYTLRQPENQLKND